MEYRHLGNSGLEVSEIGLGTNNFGGRMDAAQASGVLNAAIDHGVTLIDTANTYSHGLSEDYIGKALGDHSGKRDSAIIATKVGMDWAPGPHGQGGSRKHIMDSCEGSLRRLQTECIDLYQFHRPDSKTPLEETLRAFDDLVAQGKVRYIGNSNFAGWQIAEADWIARTGRLTPFVSAQPEYSMLERSIEAEMLPAARNYGLGILPYFPLAHGFLTGKYQRDTDVPEGTRLALTPAAQGKRLTDRNFDVIESLGNWVSERGKTLVELAFAWLLAEPQVSSVIAGASSSEQMAQNAAASGWLLSAEEKAELDSILDG